MFRSSIGLLEQQGAPLVNLREIDINVTNTCNLECIYCSYSSRPAKSEPSLSRQSICKILDEAAEMGNKAVHFSGGEPALRSDMHELIAYGASCGFKMRLLSNGTLLSRPALQELWNSGLRQVMISLDGFECNHNLHRSNSGAYAKTIQAIENAALLGYDVRVNSVATTLNVDEIPHLLPVLADMRVKTFSVFYCVPVGRGRDVLDLMVPPTRWRQFIHEMRAMVEIHAPEHMEVTVEKVFVWADEWVDGNLLQSGRGGSCLGFLDECNYVNILADGRVYPCVCFIDQAPPLGNILARPLSEILHDAASWAFYWSLAATNSTCKTCFLLPQCRGGSRALSKIVAEDWFAIDPRCSGHPQAQGFMPVCFMLRENVTTGTRSGFAEQVLAETVK